MSTVFGPVGIEGREGRGIAGREEKGRTGVVV
jgi:hypothetical protein